MQPSHTRLDPEGYYERLGLKPSATHADIVSAYRGKARVLHPDVPCTGNAEAFVAVKRAYDELSNRQQREIYDRKARGVSFEPIEPEATVVRRAGYSTASIKDRPPSLLNLALMLRVGLGAFLCLGVYQAATHLLAQRPMVPSGIRPNAASVPPLSPGAHRAVLYGPAPVRLAGTPNFYVNPAAGLATIWFLGADRNYVSLGQLPAFSAVQAVRLVRDTGMFEILLNNRGNGFIRADRLTPGNAVAARQAYCGYNAGTSPYEGEVLQALGQGHQTLEVENRAVQPTVVKLRDETGAVALSVFLGPGGRAEYRGLPDGAYYAEFAMGELWSRACNSFAVGTQAKRMNRALTLPGDAYLVLAPEAGLPPSSNISNQMFELN